MYDGNKIITGLIIFACLVTFPFLYNFGKANAKPDPKLDTPVIQQMKEKRCIETKEFMRANHMQLLDEWREAVRDGKRVYVNSKGENYKISLQNTCLKCHSNTKEFCDECHDYMSVKIYCWDCHIRVKS
ncbi:MAG: sulfate reduction electron transfer complex DsrMKJOP subunit DsrJ [Nitrospinae bacterium]|nr:sulfate reduction electron transfer complex DsrMKJOP subunit DsrJ [Nitrospinota bacterium]